MIEIGDLVEWNEITFHPNDIATLFQTIKEGRRLDNVPITTQSFIIQHTGMVEKIEEGTIVVIDFVGRCTTPFLIEDAYDKLTILNRK